MAQETLAQRVRAKHPGAYDDLDDSALESAVVAKYPGVYDDLPRTSAPSAQASRYAENQRRANAPPDDGALRVSIGERMEAQPQGNPISRGIGSWWDKVNPIEALKGIASAIKRPDLAVRSMGAAQEVPFRKAQEAWRNGDELSAVRHFMSWAIPVVGPILDQEADKFQRGEFAEGLGGTLGIATNLFGPVAVKNWLQARRITQAARPPASQPAQTPHQEAVAFGQREGIPVDLATATNNPAVRSTQVMAERSIGGALVGQRARTAQAASLTRTGERLASEVHPRAVPAELAGTRVRDAITGRVQALHQEATQSYDALRQIEATARPQTRAVAPGAPFQSMRMAVDLRGAKATLQPIYEQLSREAKLVPLQGHEAQAFRALDRLMQADNFAPLSVVDDALGSLKAFTRGTEPAMRTSGQGVVSQAIRSLDEAVLKAARTEGPRAVEALMKGRTATRAKYGAIDVLDQIRTEPVQAFNRATWAKDAGIEQLREVAKLAPKEMPLIGRAYLDDLLTTATAEGGFGRTQGLWAKWSNLGTQTKQLIFKDPALVKELNNFFLLAKKLNENPNPSGTAFTLGIGAQGYHFLASPGTAIPLQIGAAAMVKLMHSPRGVRLLTQGLQIPYGNRAAAATVAAELQAMVDDVTREAPSLVPIRAQGPGPRGVNGPSIGDSRTQTGQPSAP